MKKSELYPGYSVSQVIKGHWQMSDDHLREGGVSIKQAVEDCRKFVENGITTFDVADIYTGAEEIIGEFVKEYGPSMRRGDMPQAHIHTKYVPDRSVLGHVDFAGTEEIIDRSLSRLNVEQLDLVQFHWWDLSIPRYVEVAQHLQELKQKGKIKAIGVTNFDRASLTEILNGGVNVVSTQVQYSALDQRPMGAFTDFCKENDVKMLCYGSVAGGFLHEKYIGKPDPGHDVMNLPNRSLTKYKLIIDAIGGWNQYQEILTALDETAQDYGVSLSTIAMQYVLQKQQVSAVIVGAHNADHIGRLMELNRLPDSIDTTRIDNVIDANPNRLQGQEMYHLERYTDHAKVMKYDLNSLKS